MDKRKKVLAHLSQKKLVPSEVVKYLNDKIKSHIDLVVGGVEKLSGILDLRTPEEQEEMLGSTFEARQPNSRLSCQIEMRPEYDGLIVRMPARQT